MQTIIRIIITTLFLSGNVPFGKKDESIYFRMLKAMAIEIDKGLMPLEPFAQKLTGKKLDF